MTNNVIDASSRFDQGPKRRRSSPLDAIRHVRRIQLGDRATIATNLGRRAAEQDPAKPLRAAKLWFRRAWDGDRWDKRKRYIVLPSEQAADPQAEGAYIASGSDWAALIEQAAIASAGDTATADADRNRVMRDLLRGTQFMPALPSVPAGSYNAQALIAT